MPGPAQCRSASAHLQSPLSVTLYLASSVSLPLLRPSFPCWCACSRHEGVCVSRF